MKAKRIRNNILVLTTENIAFTQGFLINIGRDGYMLVAELERKVIR